MIEGVDYSDARPSPNGLANIGKIFAGRYVGAGYGPKMLLRPEAQALSDAGLNIVSLVEGASQDALNGYNQGVTHAAEARDWHAAQGFPWPVPCYFAVDFDVQSGQWPAVADYLRGAASVIGVEWVGIYAGLHGIEWAQRDGVARWFFQTYAWSGGIWAPGVHIEQYQNDVYLVGGTVDLDRAPSAEYGGWNMTQSFTPEQTAQSVNDNAWALNAISHLHEKTQGGQWKDVPIEISTLLLRVDKNVSAIAAGLSKPIVPPASTVDLTPVLTGLTALSTQLSDAEAATPADAVAIGKTLAADPGFVSALAAAVAAQLANIQLSMTLSGEATGGIKPPAA